MPDKPPTALRNTEKVSERKPGNFLVSSRRTHLPLQTTPKYKFQSAPSQSTKFAFGTSNAALPAPGHLVSFASDRGPRLSPRAMCALLCFYASYKTHARPGDKTTPSVGGSSSKQGAAGKPPESMLELWPNRPNLGNAFLRSLEILTKCQFTTFSRFASSRHNSDKHFRSTGQFSSE